MVGWLCVVCCVGFSQQGSHIQHRGGKALFEKSAHIFCKHINRVFFPVFVVNSLWYYSGQSELTTYDAPKKACLQAIFPLISYIISLQL